MKHTRSIHDSASLVLPESMKGTTGSTYWRSLEELANTPEFQRYLQREFPDAYQDWSNDFSRRSFLRLMGASLALAGLTGCNPAPRDQVVPSVNTPEQQIPGRPIFYATAMPWGGMARGILAESHEGRPTKIEGNPRHPASMGASDVFMQASILSLYDPDRSQVVMERGEISTWEHFLQVMDRPLRAQRDKQGKGLRILIESTTSPTLLAQLQALRKDLPQMNVHQYDAIGRGNRRAGAILAFGDPNNVVYRLDQAAVVLSLDADFLSSDPASLAYARQFSDRRRVRQHGEAFALDGTAVAASPTTSRADASLMNRLYVVEATPTITGATADHCLTIRPSLIEHFGAAVARKLGVNAGPYDEAALRPYDSWIQAAAADLQRHRGESLVIIGDGQTPALHALGHAMNKALGNFGKTVIFTDPVENDPADKLGSLNELVDDMRAGQVDLLVILGGNPVYTAPVDLDLAKAMEKVALRIHLSLYYDETSYCCQWHIPCAHYLESWGDVTAYDGTASVIQPLIAPLYDGKSDYELVGFLGGKTGLSVVDLVRNYWKGQNLAKDFEVFWRTSLAQGFIEGTALPPKDVTLAASATQPSTTRTTSFPADQGNLEIVFRPDPTIGDGASANNGWLQETPKPLTKLTWDNAAIISPGTARRLGLVSEEVVELSCRGRAVAAPIWIMPGQPDNCVTVHLGYGRTRAGRVGGQSNQTVGFNAYALRTADHPWFDSGLQLSKTGRTQRLACTQNHQLLDASHLLSEQKDGLQTAYNEELVRTSTLAELMAQPSTRNSDEENKKISLPVLPESLFPSPEHQWPGYGWGMSIDTNACIGCNACVVACQA